MKRCWRRAVSTPRWSRQREADEAEEKLRRAEQDQDIDDEINFAGAAQ